MSEVKLNEDKRQSDEGRPHRTGGGHPSDRVRAAFASAIESLKADMGADGANESEIATSLKSKIREILNEEISKKHQASSVLTAASALTSLCDMSDRSSNDGEGDEVEDNEFTCDEKTKQKEEAKQDKKSTSNRDDIPMSFPQKLMEILDDKNNEHIITWLPHGKAFIIYQKKKFATEILTKYFKESKYTSFTRKLNRWGFVRVTKGPEIGAYYHKCFQRGNYLLCMQMSCQSANKTLQRNDRMTHGQSENSHHLSPLGGPLFAKANVGVGPLSMPAMALHSQVAGIQAPMGATQFQTPQQVDYLSQQIKLMNLQRGGSANGVMQNGGLHLGAGRQGGDQYSNAVINAAVDALQRSYESNQTMCNAQKPMLAPGHPLQQHIERYQRFGIMHPGLYAAIMQQQAAAAAMVRAQQMRQEQQNKDDKSRKIRAVAKRAHAA